MKITLNEHGGQLPYARMPPVTMNTEALDSDGAQTAERLVAAAASSEESSGTGVAFDGMSYSITVESEKETTVLRQSDRRMSPAFAELLLFIKRHAP